VTVGVFELILYYALGVCVCVCVSVHVYFGTADQLSLCRSG
jgi:hypothetical protein